MPSNKTIAVAPIATGVLLAGTAAQEVAQHGLEMSTTPALAGGLSAVAVWGSGRFQWVRLQRRS